MAPTVTDFRSSQAPQRCSEPGGAVARPVLVIIGAPGGFEGRPVRCLAGGAEIVAVTTNLTRQKFRETNLLDRSHIVDDPRTLPKVVRDLINLHGQPLRAAE